MTSCPPCCALHHPFCTSVSVPLLASAGGGACSGPLSSTSSKQPADVRFAATTSSTCLDSSVSALAFLSALPPDSSVPSSSTKSVSSFTYESWMSHVVTALAISRVAGGATITSLFVCAKLNVCAWRCTYRSDP